MERVTIKELFAEPEKYADKEITAAGWCRSIRASNVFGFLTVNDGSCFGNLQIVLESEKLENYKEVTAQNSGASFIATGIFTLTPDAKQPFELKATAVEVEGTSTPDYPLQSKKHSMEFLRSIAHLRPRANTFNAVFRVRSECAFAIHSFFHQRGFVYVHTPIITGSDCEGAGEMFRITTLDLDDLPLDENGKVDYSKDFFGKSTNLTVSGQLNAEAFAMAFANIYTFGPTFRAEVSNTPRHAAEFWMMEPEIAFADLNDDMALAEDMLKFIVNHLLTTCRAELEFFNQFFDKTLLERLENIVSSDFVRLPYTKAIELLQTADKKFEYPVTKGKSEHRGHTLQGSQEGIHIGASVVEGEGGAHGAADAQTVHQGLSAMVSGAYGHA